MAVDYSNAQVRRQFADIVRPQIRLEMSATLSDMLAASVNHAISKSAIDYVLNKLWTSDIDPRSTK